VSKGQKLKTFALGKLGSRGRRQDQQKAISKDELSSCGNLPLHQPTYSTPFHLRNSELVDVEYMKCWMK
jgi:hypothetical protein